MKMLKNLLSIIFQVKESFISSIGSIRDNKTRTMLTLLGITIGITAIISAYTIIDSLKRVTEEQFSALGAGTIIIQKFPIGNSGMSWQQVMARPAITNKEYKQLDKIVRDKYKETGFTTYVNITAKYGKEYSKSSLTSYDGELDKLLNVKIEEGRQISHGEVIKGSKVVLIGQEVATSLFGNISPINKVIKLNNIKYSVVGLLKKTGNELTGSGLDRSIIAPYSSTKELVPANSTQGSIMLNAPSSQDIDNEMEYVRSKYRVIRKLSPTEKDDFSLISKEQITNLVDNIFGTINLAGMVIGLFSILIGGIGVANIMFVSVKERTTLIGVQKALGAKSYVILLSFLFEASFLSLIGGAIGLILVYILTIVGSKYSPMELILTFENSLIGVGISIVVGVISGYIPAKKAAKLDPIKAIYNI